MDQIWLHLLSLAVHLSLTLSKPQEYILVRELMTWKKAQQYCRTNHFDLATIQSDEDWAAQQEANNDAWFHGFAWFGLYNDLDSWRWTHNDKSITYKAWGLNQPNKNGAGEECGTINVDGYWYDVKCESTLAFVCMDESTNSTNKMVLIQSLRTWDEAQKYCRMHYTDLATVSNKEDNDQIANMAHTVLSSVWVGLYRDSWKWSDQANFTSSTQSKAQKLIGFNENCVVTDYYRVIEDVGCDLLYYCICSTVRRKMEVIRVKVKAKGNADDATLTTLVLNKLQQTLSDEDITLTLREQPNGKVFQKVKTIKKSSNVSASVC